MHIVIHLHMIAMWLFLLTYLISFYATLFYLLFMLFFLWSFYFVDFIWVKIYMTNNLHFTNCWFPYFYLMFVCGSCWLPHFTTILTWYRDICAFLSFFHILTLHSLSASVARSEDLMSLFTVMRESSIVMITFIFITRQGTMLSCLSHTQLGT